ncbi:MAG TPA: hypothetical protein VH496_04255 [Mycobacterium sp.]|jgi:hypothetical protein
MTGPEDNQDSRPISVAELLARNGTIGAKPVSSRRRRRRGNAQAVTVAELTGEIPVVTDGALETVTAPEPEVSEPEPDESADTELDSVPAEEMEPDPVDLDDEDAAIAVQEDTEEEPDEDVSEVGEVDEAVDAGEVDEDAGELDEADQVDVDETEDVDEDVDVAEDIDEDEAEDLPAYLQATPETLFGFGSAHEDLRRADDTEHEAEDEEAEAPTRMQRVTRGVLIVLQSILAVAFGAALFIGFDELWKWNNVVALVLSVLVILGLVAAVWVVRKTEDIASTLIAVAVGALVTMGPLVLHSN